MMSNPAVWQFSLNALHAAMWGGSLLVALIVFSRFVTLRTLAVATLLATVALVMLGAYVRLTNAGLGCPDWPGCYGKLSPTQAADQIQAAEMAAPEGPVSLPKAWREMVHRYFASFVGVMILAIAIQTLNNRRKSSADPDDPARKISGRFPGSVASRKIHAGQGRIVRADPATQCDLQAEHDQSDRRQRTDAA